MVRYTQHARDRMAEYAIDAAWIDRTIDQPNRTAPDPRLQPGQHQLPFGQGQTQVCDITEIIRSGDRHDVDGLLLTVSLGFHQPHNPSHASTPNQRTDTK